MSRLFQIEVVGSRGAETVMLIIEGHANGPAEAKRNAVARAEIDGLTQCWVAKARIK